MLGTRYIEEPLALGISGQTIASPKEDEIARIEPKLRVPRAPRPDIDKLPAALEQRAAAWREDLRAEPKVARVVLRRLVPLEFDDSERPEWIPQVDANDVIPWTAEVKPSGCWKGSYKIPKKWRPQKESTPFPT